MTRDQNPDRLDDGARAEAEMKERGATLSGKEIAAERSDYKSAARATIEERIEAGLVRADDACDCGECTVEECDDCCTPNPLPAPQGDDGLVSGGVYECEDCVGMKDHGCFCLAMGASRPGGDEAADTVTDEMVTAFAIGAQMGDGNFTSSEPSIQRALDSSKARIKTGLEAALRAPAVEIAELERVVAGLNKQLTEQFELSTRYIAKFTAAESLLAEAREALEPFADYADVLDSCYPTRHGGELEVSAKICSPDDLRRMVTITLAHCRAARATLSRLKPGEKGGGNAA